MTRQRSAAVTITDFLLERYPGPNERRRAIRDFVATVTGDFIKSGLADRNFEQEMCSGDESRYWQRLTEALVARRLACEGGVLVPSRDGPDLLMLVGAKKIWIEVIAPTPSGIPASWLQPADGECHSLPHKEILLRWTSAIKEKAEKLIGNPERGVIGYIEKGVVGEDDSYVIAVNGRLLRRNGFPQMFGISQFPFAVEAVFPVGPIQVSIDLRTNEISGSAYQHRPFVINKNGSSVPTSIFLDPAYRKISAIWAMDIDECEVIGNTQYLEVVHNPNATQPIPSRLLPASAEYVASRSQEEDQYILERQDRVVET